MSARSNAGLEDGTSLRFFCCDCAGVGLDFRSVYRWCRRAQPTGLKSSQVEEVRDVKMPKDLEPKPVTRSGSDARVLASLRSKVSGTLLIFIPRVGPCGIGK